MIYHHFHFWAEVGNKDARRVILCKIPIKTNTAMPYIRYPYVC
jgi:hypothetical protein